MTTITLDEFQQDPDQTLNRVAAGERVVVVRGGQPVAELHPVGRSLDAARPIGLCAGQFKVPEDFDAPLPPDVLREFEGR